MRVLIDTHAVLWWDSAEHRLSERARSLMRDPTTEIAISVASIFEIAIKVAKGDLELPAAVDRYLPKRIRQYRWDTLPILTDHALRAAALPRIHADPFDRLLIAQSQVEGLPLVTTDPAITRYEVETIW